jgi:eukaryotic-like serine/threonine-protein kinase
MTSPHFAGAAARPAGSPESLRSFLGRQRAAGRPVPLGLAIEILVPLCAELGDIHEQGYGLYLYPSNLVQNATGGFSVASGLAAVAPSLPEDIACLAPEVRPEQLGSARSSVYALGAIFYELLTGASVAPGMRRPQELVPGLPPIVETVLSKALIRDPAHRPDDLFALAQALYAMAPSQRIPPPSRGDENVLNDVSVDVSLSMLPPANPGAARVVASGTHNIAAMNAAMGLAHGKVSPGLGNGLNVAVRLAPAASPGDDATASLAALKARLEADPSPRYVVIRDGMDHGPFSAVELLQQIRAHAFVENDVLQDRTSGAEKPIRSWDEFAPFADHARRHRDIAEEKAAIDRGVAQESKRTKGKAFLGLLLLGVLLAGAGAWFVTQKGTRSDEVAVQTENASNIEAEGALAVKKGTGTGGKRVVGSQGGIPQLGGGMSCEGAQASYVEELKMTGGGPADISRGAYASVMNSGAYFSHCGVPSSVAVNICVAVQGGRAVGVTVNTTPNHGSKSCIASAVRRLGFPSNPKLDVVRVNFAAN